MSLPESSPVPNAVPQGHSPAPTPPLTGLERSVQDLRFLVQNLLAILILLVAVINLYLHKQGRILSAQRANVAHSVRQTSRSLAEFRAQFQPGIERLLADLQRFGDQNPDFARQILAKYPANPANKPTGTNAPAASPAVVPGVKR